MQEITFIDQIDTNDVYIVPCFDEQANEFQMNFCLHQKGVDHRYESALWIYAVFSLVQMCPCKAAVHFPLSD